MSDEVPPAKRMMELPEETREFLAQLRPEDIATIKDGVHLVNAVRTVGTFAKWLIVGILGLFVGAVMFVESIQKMLGWIKPH